MASRTRPNWPTLGQDANKVLTFRQDTKFDFNLRSKCKKYFNPRPKCQVPSLGLGLNFLAQGLTLGQKLYKQSYWIMFEIGHIECPYVMSLCGIGKWTIWNTNFDIWNHIRNVRLYHRLKGEALCSLQFMHMYFLHCQN